MVETEIVETAFYRGRCCVALVGSYPWKCIRGNFIIVVCWVAVCCQQYITHYSAVCATVLWAMLRIKLHSVVLPAGFLFTNVKQNIRNLQICPPLFCVCVLYMTDTYCALDVRSQQVTNQEPFSSRLFAVILVLVWTRLLHRSEHHGDVHTKNHPTAGNSLIDSFWWREK